MNNRLSFDRFRQIVLSYGSCSGSWPAAEREAAMKIAQDPELAALLREAEQLDDLLAAYEVSGVSAAFYYQVAGTIPATRRYPSWRAWWLPGTAAAATALAGMVAGALLFPIVMDRAFEPSNDSYALGYGFWDAGDLL